MTPPPKPRTWRRAIGMFALIASAEAVFVLPFVLPRIFRPTMLEVMDLTHWELGVAFSAYGTVGMASYFLGGPIADLFAPRRIMTVALVLTCVGGAALMVDISTLGLKVLYAWWGVTSILLYWAALIRATREWGGDGGDGAAFGLLDGGRGLLAAVVSSASVALFAWALGGDPDAASLEQRGEALRVVIMAYMGLVLCAALLTWTVLSDDDGKAAGSSARPAWRSGRVRELLQVLKLPQVYLQGLIVLCAYTAFKGSDDYAQIAVDGWGMDAVEAASVGTLSFWVRPIAALGAGLLSDRVRGSWVLLVCFGALVVCDGLVWAGVLPTDVPMALFVMVVATSAFTYALRGVYFAIFDEGKVPMAVTGTAVGVVSFFGYTPDIFFGPLMGALLDGTPGMAGHQSLFGVLALFAVLGALASAAFSWVAARAKGEAAA